MLRRPCSLRRGDAVVLLGPRHNAEGMERREALHQFRTLRCGRPLRKDAIAPRRSIAVSYGVRAALLARGFPHAISELLAAGHSAGGRSPGAARAHGVRFAMPAGTASDPTVMTPHESALEWIGPG